MTFDELHLRLLRAANPRNYDTVGAMTPGLRGRIGVPMGEVRRIVRDLMRGDPADARALLAAVEAEDDRRRARGAAMPQEALWTALIVAACIPAAFSERLELTERFAGRAEGWAACDLFGAELADFGLPGNREAAFGFVERLIASGEVWRIRLALVILLFHLAPAGGPELARALDLTLGANPLAAARSDYYGSMALAWALSVYAVHDPDVTARALGVAAADGRMDPATARRAAQKVRESLRTAPAVRALFTQTVRRALKIASAGRGSGVRAAKRADNVKPKGAPPALRRRKALTAARAKPLR